MHLSNYFRVSVIPVSKRNLQFYFICQVSVFNYFVALLIMKYPLEISAQLVLKGPKLYSQ